MLEEKIREDEADLAKSRQAFFIALEHVHHIHANSPEGKVPVAQKALDVAKDRLMKAEELLAKDQERLRRLLATSPTEK